MHEDLKGHTHTMKIRITDTLTEEDITAVNRLTAACMREEPTAVTFPADEEDTDYILAEDDGVLLAAMALCRIDEAEYECMAWVLPEVRRKGWFTALWEEAEELLADRHGDEEAAVSFVTDVRSVSAPPVLQRLGADPGAEELEMNVPLVPIPPVLPPEAFRLISDPKEQTARYAVTAADLTPEFLAKLPGDLPAILREAAAQGADRVPLFAASVLEGSDGQCWLFEIEVAEPVRGLGFGTCIFPDFLSFLEDELGLIEAGLQVSADNVPAVRLYEKNGFHTAVALKYYELMV